MAFFVAEMAFFVGDCFAFEVWLIILKRGEEGRKRVLVYLSRMFKFKIRIQHLTVFSLSFSNTQNQLMAYYRHHHHHHHRHQPPPPSTTKIVNSPFEVLIRFYANVC